MSDISKGREKLKKLYDAEVEKVLSTLSENESELEDENAFSSNDAFNNLDTSAERLRTLSLLLHFLPADQSHQDQHGNNVVIVDNGVGRRYVDLNDFFQNLTNDNVKEAVRVLTVIFKIPTERAATAAQHFWNAIKDNPQEGYQKMIKLGQVKNIPQEFKKLLTQLFGFDNLEVARIYEQHSTE